MDRAQTFVNTKTPHEVKPSCFAWVLPCPGDSTMPRHSRVSMD